jgi:SH3-like domain-containing protein
MHPTAIQRHVYGRCSGPYDPRDRVRLGTSGQAGSEGAVAQLVPKVVRTGFLELSMNMRSVRQMLEIARTFLAVALFGVAVLLSSVSSSTAQPSGMVGFDELPAERAVAQNPTQSEAGLPDQFNAAEEALLQGFNRHESAAPSVRHTFPSAAQIREVAAVKPASDQPTIRRVKSQDIPTILDSIPAEEPEALDTEAAPDRPVAATLQEAKAVRAKPSEQKPSATPAKKVAVTSTKNSILQEKLTASELRTRDLERQLMEVKSQLAAAELEISRLSSVVQNNSRARLNLPQNAVAPQVKTKTSSPATTPQTAPAPRPVTEKVADPASDLHVATVAVDKADLRLGPGKNHSALMTLRKGSRLAIEARQGEWYRVFAPNGQRAWIHSSLVRFGEGAASLNDGSSVRMRGFDDSLR